jgi:hypothetical protein
MDIPIACTLEQAEAEQRVERWRDVLARAVARVERIAPDRLSFELNPDLADLRALALLAQEEKACCGFFTFALGVEADAVTLMVGVPHDAVTLLDGFAALAIREPSPWAKDPAT